MTEPIFSVIVPTYNRPRSLAQCLHALSRLDYPSHHFEVLVVDDGGSPALADIVTPFRRQLDVRLLTQRHAGPAAARNTGAIHARGRFLAFTDDDCTPDASWLKAFAACFAETSDCLFGGRVVNALPANPYSTASQLLVDYAYAHFGTPRLRTPFFASNNMAVSATGFRAVGGFDPRFRVAAAEDRDICDRWRHSGRRLRYAATAVIYHRHDLNLRSFWRQQLRYGRGASRFHTGRARRISDRITLEAPRFYLELLRYPLSQRQAPRAISVVFLVAISQAAIGLGFAYERVAQRARG